MAYQSWDMLKALVMRTHDKTVHIKIEDLKKAQCKAMEMYVKNGVIRLVASDIMDWPENEKRIDAIGQNGNDGDHYDKTTGSYHFDGFI